MNHQAAHKNAFHFFQRNHSRGRELEALLAAISKSQAVIEFNMDGTIITANGNFLDATGYRLDEIAGRHHRMFVDGNYARSREHEDFWATLNRGEYSAAEYQRFGKNGKEIWIQASYNPILDSHGKPYKVVKFATDITREKLRSADYAGQLAAISKSQAVIEFNMDGTIITANPNFLAAVGYSLDEIKGKHHRMFVDPGYALNPVYQEFWAKLGRGEYSSAEYRRFGKGGKEIWIQASYNPILDLNGKPFKVVKYATDITQEKLRNADYAGQLEAIGKSQAVIEFNMDGTIITANANFLGAVGYDLEEIKGRHHRMFVDPTYAQSHEYQDFWASLRRGEYSSAEYQRFGNGGKEIWIQASYNPILDLNGRPFKVVKYATDITRQVLARKKSEQLIRESLGNVQTVAAASEEMTASIREISSNMSVSKNSVDEIARQLNQADEMMIHLKNTSTSMESVADLIRDIAGQVNLLALNATIEAARAGDAGKGFAVVASEVKNLASQVGKATDDISHKIKLLQEMSSKAAASTGSINQSTKAVTHSVGATAAAIEEQTAVTQEISSKMQMIAQGINEINTCVGQISSKK